MIKALGRFEGEPLIMLGLSTQNLKRKRMRKGEPVYIKLEELGFPKGHLLIMWGPNEAAIAKKLGAFSMGAVLTCHHCEGAGTVDGKPCEVCEGKSQRAN